MAEAFIIRQPEADDAQGINELFLKRYDDIAPGPQSWKGGRKLFLRRRGIGYFDDKIKRARALQKEYFARVATVDDEIAGFACAIADPGNRVLARLVGLVVDREYERNGIGTALEEARQEWANKQRRILYGQLVYEGEQAWHFYDKHGYKEFGTRVMAETTFRLINHPLPQDSPPMPTITWSDRLPDDEPLLY